MAYSLIASTPIRRVQNRSIPSSGGISSASVPADPESRHGGTPPLHRFAPSIASLAILMKDLSMSHNHPSPHGYPQDPITGGTPPNGKATRAATRATRPWYKKKRAILPAGVLALSIVTGVAGCGGGDTDPTAVTSSSSATLSATEDVQLAEATASAEEEAAQEAEASASAEAEASEKAEAEARAAEEAEASQKAEEEVEAEEEARAAEEAAAEAEAEAAAEAEAEAERGTLSQQNALRSAEDYLDYTAFSRTGLIGQLEFEEYSTADATWAVDRVTVDWNEQAAKSAANYLDYTSFSRAGLIDQLIFEGFTAEQAQYGVSQTGL
ncbi:Ltp family lipoprotein [Citricoccus parietis]|uniref:Ltp family lipoprotein n=2 Tax=Citricoccus parietis TaxID=592307 RepID=A0ABV5G070_9MICC